MMHLYTYCRSSAAYRVRIALQFKGLEYEPEFVNLLKNENLCESYLALNPQGAVPVLVHQGKVLTQSIAILEYLEEMHPLPSLLPSSSKERAIVRSYALQMVSDIQPLHNKRVLTYLTTHLGFEQQGRQGWIQHWMEEGLRSLEKRAFETAGAYMVGRNITMADICLVPQIYLALRFEIDTSAYPILMGIYSRCMDLEPFQQAAPENQSYCKVVSLYE